MNKKKQKGAENEPKIGEVWNIPVIFISYDWIMMHYFAGYYGKTSAVAQGICLNC
jgi:hypothetical protein